mmetsp:Transcript_4768/g.9408  ORF Transcript_4768/g.9408 Transcript_4768/m.9408 type:complete len:217 (+) Transcript_4768:66-716(+)
MPSGRASRAYRNRRGRLASRDNAPPSSSVTVATVGLPLRLRDMLDALSTTIETLKSWPAETGERAEESETVHDVRTAEFMGCVRRIASAISRVEKITNDDTCRKFLDRCRVPLDLLDLLDFGYGSFDISGNKSGKMAGTGATGGLNPELYARGIMEEAMRQHAALQRRRGALRDLGLAVREWLEEKKNEDGTADVTGDSSLKSDTAVKKKKGTRRR